MFFFFFYQHFLEGVSFCDLSRNIWKDFCWWFNIQHCWASFVVCCFSQCWSLWYDCTFCILWWRRTYDCMICQQWAVVDMMLWMLFLQRRRWNKQPVCSFFNQRLSPVHGPAGWLTPLKFHLLCKDNCSFEEFWCVPTTTTRLGSCL